MTDQDRGAYTPQTDAPLAFDARYSRGAGGRPIPLTLIVSGVVLLVLVAALGFFYRHGIRGPAETPQVVGSPVVDTKAPPSAQPASDDAAAGLQIYKSEAVPPGEGRTPTTATLAPPPETPAPRPVPVTPTEQANLRPALPQAALPTPVAPAPAGSPAATAAAIMATHAGPAKASVKPKPIKLAQAAVAAKPATAPAADAAPAVAGGVVAQIGAFSSEALAQKGWSDVAALVPGQMSGKTRKVEEASRDGKTFYRAFVGGFASKAAAQSFCASLAARGHGCMVK